MYVITLIEGMYSIRVCLFQGPPVKVSLAHLMYTSFMFHQEYNESIIIYLFIYFISVGTLPLLNEHNVPPESHAHRIKPQTHTSPSCYYIV